MNQNRQNTDFNHHRSLLNFRLKITQSMILAKKRSPKTTRSPAIADLCSLLAKIAKKYKVDQILGWPFFRLFAKLGASRPCRLAPY